MPDSLHDGDSVYRTLFDSAGDAMFVHTENKIWAVNRKACEMLGYTEDELLSMRPH
ncbi:MAG: PAS domain S-box protein [Lentisphaerae bacterium]|nr:PAS domain S-box protein [Lentisphaerota bacterium]